MWIADLLGPLALEHPGVLEVVRQCIVSKHAPAARHDFDPQREALSCLAQLGPPLVDHGPVLGAVYDSLRPDSTLSYGAKKVAEQALQRMFEGALASPKIALLVKAALRDGSVHSIRCAAISALGAMGPACVDVSGCVCCFFLDLT